MIMKFRRKSTIIEVNQFNSEILPWPEGVKAHNKGFIVDNEPIKSGDYIFIGFNNDLFPMDRAKFEATYEKV